MRVRERKQRKKSERHPATSTAAAADSDPVVMLVMSLLATMSVTYDRILFTSRASA
jgi:hypothetical protein